MSDGQPLVHGYISIEYPDETEIAVASKDICSYCALNGYRLGSIFIDRGVPDDVFARRGFTDLLDAIRVTSAHAVVTPSLAHLSSQAFILDALKRMVELAGAQVLVIATTNSGDPRADNGRGIGTASGAPS